VVIDVSSNPVARQDGAEPAPRSAGCAAGPERGLAD